MRKTAFLLAALVAMGCQSADPGPATESEHVGEAQLAAESLVTPSRPNVIRFLEQATFGPRVADIDHVMSVGITAAITEQFGKPIGTYTGLNPDGTDRDPAAEVFEQALSGDDQLRQRVALALSQIFVISLTNNNNEPATADYLQMLRTGAFGNYRDLMFNVTVHPVMGKFLNMANNVAFDTAGNPIAPDENYARELMQLFTLGLEELNDDGTVQLDIHGKPVPTYNQDQVENLAHALTGWTYWKADAAGNGVCPTKGAKRGVVFGHAMMPCDVNHDPNSQALLNGFSTTQLPAAPASGNVGTGTLKHLNEALDNIFKDNSTPPYICKQLIQHLVTSNPTPAYVKRVVAKFKNNGSGVRGDMKAVIRQILEDDEARGPVPPFALQGTYGHLRPPVLFITNSLRWLNGTTTAGASLNSWSAKMGQQIPRPPSVFSYYPPSNPLPDDSGLLGPEFAIASTATALERANFLNQILFKTITGTTIDLTVVPDDPAAMLQWVDDNVMHDTMSSQSKSIILDAITNASVPASKKKALALYLAMTSPDYQSER